LEIRSLVEDRKGGVQLPFL